MVGEVNHAEILLAVASQSLTYDPPELYRPSGTPTVTVYRGYADDSASGVSATTGAASVDSVDTTLSAAASIGDTEVSVTSATGIARDRRYLVTDASGAIEQLEVRGVSGTTVYLRTPLANDYASGATLQGQRITIAIDDTWAADTSNLTDSVVDTTDVRFSPGADVPIAAAGYRVRWSYTVNSIPTIGVSYFDLVRYHAKTLVRPLDVDRLFPGWIDRLPPDYRVDQGAALIQEAFSSIKMDALADSQLVRRIRDTQVLAELVKYRANVLAMQNDVMAGRRDASAYALANDLYDRRYNQLIREPKIAVDQTGGGANDAGIRQPAFVR